MEGAKKLHIKMIHKDLKKRHQIALATIEQLWELASKTAQKSKEELTMTYEDLQGDEIDIVGQEDVDTLVADLEIEESGIKAVKIYVREKGEEIKRKRGHLETAWVMDAQTGRRVKYFSNSFERGKFIEKMQQKDYREVIKRKKAEHRIQAKYEILRNQIEKDAERQKRILERELEKKLKKLEEQEQAQRQSLQKIVENVGERPSKSKDNKTRVKKTLAGFCLMVKGKTRPQQQEGAEPEMKDIEERKRDEKRVALMKTMPGVSEEIIRKVVKKHWERQLNELQALVMDEIMNKIKAVQQREREGCEAGLVEASE